GVFIVGCGCRPEPGSSANPGAPRCRLATQRPYVPRRALLAPAAHRCIECSAARPGLGVRRVRGAWADAPGRGGFAAAHRWSVVLFRALECCVRGRCALGEAALAV